MKHYAMARKEVFEDAALKPSGAMPKNAGDKSEAESEAEAKQNAKQTESEANGAAEEPKKKSPQNAGFSKRDTIPLHLEQQLSMGDTGLEPATSTV